MLKRVLAVCRGINWYVGSSRRITLHLPKNRFHIRKFGNRRHHVSFCGGGQVEQTITNWTKLKNKVDQGTPRCTIRSAQLFSFSAVCSILLGSVLLSGLLYHKNKRPVHPKANQVIKKLWLFHPLTRIPLPENS